MSVMNTSSTRCHATDKEGIQSFHLPGGFAWDYPLTKGDKVLRLFALFEAEVGTSHQEAETLRCDNQLLRARLQREVTSAAAAAQVAAKSFKTYSTNSVPPSVISELDFTRVQRESSAFDLEFSDSDRGDSSEGAPHPLRTSFGFTPRASNGCTPRASYGCTPRSTRSSLATGLAAPPSSARSTAAGAVAAAVRASRLSFSESSVSMMASTSLDTTPPWSPRFSEQSQSRRTTRHSNQSQSRQTPRVSGETPWSQRQAELESTCIALPPRLLTPRAQQQLAALDEIPTQSPGGLKQSFPHRRNRRRGGQSARSGRWPLGNSLRQAWWEWSKAEQLENKLQHIEAQVAAAAADVGEGVGDLGEVFRDAMDFAPDATAAADAHDRADSALGAIGGLLCRKIVSLTAPEARVDDDSGLQGI